MNLSERIIQADEKLASYATPHEGKLGRVVPEPDDRYRFAFERDRHRIAETNAYRRMSGKTQVFANGTSDHFRTRLTHTGEVSNVGRTIARVLNLNEDHVEASILVHDIGHPPFGHEGEDTLEMLLQEGYETGFNHNIQGYRLVTAIEHRDPRYKGLNLMREITNGMLKNGLKHPATRQIVEHTLEARVADVADRIAYLAHDIEDGLSSGILKIGKLRESPLADEIIRKVGPDPAMIRAELLRFIPADVIETSAKLLETDHSIEAIRASNDVARGRDELYQVLKKNLYSSEEVQGPRRYGREMIIRLFRQYMKTPPAEVIDLQRRTEEPLHRAVADYIAGMTDSFALRMGMQIA